MPHSVNISIPPLYTINLFCLSLAIFELAHNDCWKEDTEASLTIIITLLLDMLGSSFCTTTLGLVFGLIFIGRRETTFQSVLAVGFSLAKVSVYSVPALLLGRNRIPWTVILGLAREQYNVFFLPLCDRWDLGIPNCLAVTPRVCSGEVDVDAMWTAGPAPGQGTLEHFASCLLKVQLSFFALDV